MYAILKNMPRIPEEKMVEIFSDRFVIFINVQEGKKSIDGCVDIMSGVPLIVSDKIGESDIIDGGTIDYDNKVYIVENGGIYIYNTRNPQSSGKDSTVASVCESLERYLLSIGHTGYEIIKGGEPIDE